MLIHIHTRPHFTVAVTLTEQQCFILKASSQNYNGHNQLYLELIIERFTLLITDTLFVIIA